MVSPDTSVAETMVIFPSASLVVVTFVPPFIKKLSPASISLTELSSAPTPIDPPPPEPPDPALSLPFTHSLPLYFKTCPACGVVVTTLDNSSILLGAILITFYTALMQPKGEITSKLWISYIFLAAIIGFFTSINK